MSRRPKEPLRALSAEERGQLEHASRSLTMPVDQVIHAEEVLAVAEGHTFTDAARLVGRKSGDAVAHLITRFNAEGLSALETRHGAVLPSALPQCSVSGSCVNFAVLLIAGSTAPPPGHWSRCSEPYVVRQTVFPR